MEPDSGHRVLGSMSQQQDQEQDQQEASLRERLADVLAQFTSAATDLATHLLSKGRVDEAQELLEQLVALRQPQLAAAAKDVQARLAAVTLSPPVSDARGAPGALPSQQADLQATADATGTSQQAAAGSDDEDSWETHEPVLKTTAGLPTACLHPVADSRAPTFISRDGNSSRPTKVRPKTPVKSSGPDQEEQESTAGGSSRSTKVRSRTPVSSSGQEQDGPEVVWEGGFTHCVEVYGLTLADKTSHLQEVLDELLPGVALQPRIQWADDNHAVYVCPDTTTAELLLESASDLGFKVRPFNDASQASKQLPISELLPPKARPKTTTAVARKLLSHALGIPALRDKGAEQELAAARRVARQERAAKREAAESAWGDDT